MLRLSWQIAKGCWKTQNMCSVGFDSAQHQFGKIKTKTKPNQKTSLCQEERDENITKMLQNTKDQH